MHRIECVPCTRPFTNKEALQQHLKTSSLWHPVCIKCDKRFSSTSGLEAHAAAKHPPTFDCHLCGKEYRQSFALDDHYRGSPNHPNCPRCGKGFRDEQELILHQNSIHPKIHCGPCNVLLYEDQDCLRKHYEGSPMHPNCPVCNQGCRDDGDLEIHMCSHESPVGEVVEPSEQVAPSPSSSDEPHFNSITPNPDPSPPSPSPPSPELSPLENGSPDVARHSFIPTWPAAPSTITPLNPRPAMKGPLGLFGARPIESTPPLTLSTAFATSLMNVQAPFGPLSGLMPPSLEADRIWAAKENRQINPNSPPQPSVSVSLLPPLSSFAVKGADVTNGIPGTTMPEWRRRTSPTTTSTASVSRAFDPLESSPPATSSSARVSITPTIGPPSARGAFRSLPRAPSPSGSQASSFLPRQLSPPFTFSPRLYPGLARQATLREAEKGANGWPSPPPQPPFSSSTSTTPSAPPNGLDGSARKHAYKGSNSDIIDWQALLGDEDELHTEVQTPRAESPSRSNAMGQINISSPTPSSSSFAFITNDLQLGRDDDSKAGGSLLSPSTANGSSGRLQASELTFSSSASASSSYPHSPSVSSPPGLQRLPSISPTPLESSFWMGIPEAGQPLPESLPPSPGASAGDILPSPLLSEPSPSVSYRTSPQDPLASPPRSAPEAALSLPSHHEHVERQHQALEQLDDDVQVSCVRISATSTASDDSSRFGRESRMGGGIGSDDSDTPQTVATSVTSHSAALSPLHCRECKADSCHDTTATMCGHIFCYECITTAVINTSRCPVCSTPTLLYCLFRLDLAA